jgi:acetyltransferase-like isoleucine patch superfamily enzyme
MNFAKRYYEKIRLLFKTINSIYQQQEYNNSLKESKGSHFHGGNRFDKFQIGNNSYVSFNSILYNCSVGNYCSIGPNVVIGVGDHPYNYLTTSPNVYFDNRFFSIEEQEGLLERNFKKVVIKNDVWIGANVFIKNGVTIGNGAIIGAGSVVLNDVSDFEIVGGVPAKRLKMRFTDDIIQLIIRTNWWDKSLNELSKIADVVKDPSREKLEEIIRNSSQE